MTEDQIEALENFVVAVVKAHTDQPHRGYYRELSALEKAFGEAKVSPAQKLEQALEFELDVDVEAQYIVKLHEAQEAAARADAKAEELYAKLVEVNSWAEKRAEKLRKQEQTIQTLQNTVSRLGDDNARLRGELNGANSANAKLRGELGEANQDLEYLKAQREQQRLARDMRSDHIESLEKQLQSALEAAARADKVSEGRYRACQALELEVDRQRKKLRQQEQTIQTLREKSAVALIQRMRDDIGAADQARWTREHLLSALGTYERGFS